LQHFIQFLFVRFAQIPPTILLVNRRYFRLLTTINLALDLGFAWFSVNLTERRHTSP